MNQDRKNVLISILGHIFEHFESSIFTFVGAFTATYFFAQDGSWLSTYGAYIAISSGLILAPFGAFIFSWIGDHLGRRPAMITAYSVCIIPSIIIPLIPSYQQVGIMASILLIVARIFQGLGGGGAFAGRVVLVAEGDPRGRNLNMGILMALGFFGALLGTSLSSFFMSIEGLKWGWKIPYFLAAFLGLLVLYLRRHLSESPEWIKNKAKNKKTNTIPIVGCLKKYPLSMFCVFLFGISMLIPFYYGNIWVAKYMEMDSIISLQYTSLSMFISGLALIFFFWMITYVSYLKMLVGGALAILFCGGIMLAGFYADIPHFNLIYRTVIALTTSLCVPPIILLSHRLFPVQYRYTGFAVPFFLGQAVGNGPTPFYAEMIFQHSGSLPLTTLLIFVSGAFLLLAAVLIKQYQLLQKGSH